MLEAYIGANSYYLLYNNPSDLLDDDELSVKKKFQFNWNLHSDRLTDEEKLHLAMYVHYNSSLLQEFNRISSFIMISITIINFLGRLQNMLSIICLSFIQYICMTTREKFILLK